MGRLSSVACFGGRQEVWSYTSTALQGTTKIGVFVPPQAQHGSVPVLVFLSGLTCTEQNVITKAGLQQHCAKHGILLVCPDTSPRGEDVADDDGWDLGQGAGFYVNATQAPWAEHYQMDSFITQELPAFVSATFPTTGRTGIMGHSMGGHGALVLALRNPGQYVSVSAFAPIVAPTQVPWGHKAFGAYLGTNRQSWAAYDACELIAQATERLPLLVDQGTDDSFLDEQLQPQRLQDACAAAGHPLTLRMQPGYDHSYFFISTFAGDHVDHHAAALLA